jgi:hypothetical protein
MALKIYCKGKVLGSVEFDEQQKAMNGSTNEVKRIIESLRETHFSSTTPDEEIYNELPILLRGIYYCRGE